LASYKAEVLADQPFAYWRLREKTGTTAAAEVGGFPGTYTGGYVLGVSGPVYDGAGVKLDGSTGYVDTASGSALNVGSGPVSIEFWVKRNSTGTKDEVIAHGGSSIDVLFSDAGLPGGADKMQLWNGSVQMAVEATTLTDTTGWHHYVITWAGAGSSNSVSTIYRDGVDNTGTPNGPGGTFSDSANNLRIGQTTAGANPFDGSIAEVALYNHVLTPARILAHYNAALTQDTGPAFQGDSFQDGAFQDPTLDAFQDDSFQDDSFQEPHRDYQHQVQATAELASGQTDILWDPYELDSPDEPEAETIGQAVAKAFDATVTTAAGNSTNAPAELTTATGAAYDVHADIAPTAGSAAATAAANAATPSVAPNAGNAAAVAAALPAVGAMSAWTS
jgi:hypothetical protein